MRKETTFIYCLKDPIHGCVRYIGKSDKPKKRYAEHLRANDSNRHKCNWIKSLKSSGKKPELVIIEECNKEDWQEREVYWIDYYINTGKLTNLVSGGNGFISIYLPSEQNVIDAIMIYADNKFYEIVKSISFDDKVSLMRGICLALGRIGNIENACNYINSELNYLQS